VKVAVCMAPGSPDRRAERLARQRIEARTVTAAEQLGELGEDWVAWVDTAAARTWLAAEPAAGPAAWAATCAHAAAALRWARPVIADVPGDPDVRPARAPDSGGRSGLVAPIDGVDDDRVAMLADAFAGVPGSLHLLMLTTGPRPIVIADPRIDLLVGSSPTERADRVRRAIAMVLVGRDRAEPDHAMEAFGLGTGVVAVSDGGADLELVRDGWTGRVVPPTVDALAEVLDAQVATPELPAASGARGRVLWELRDWDRCRRRLRAALTIRSVL